MGQVIVKTEHPTNSMLPVACTQCPMRSRDCQFGGFAFLFSLVVKGKRKEDEMKLYVFFFLIDVLILLAYPFIFIASKVRKIFSFKR